MQVHNRRTLRSANLLVVEEVAITDIEATGSKRFRGLLRHPPKYVVRADEFEAAPESSQGAGLSPGLHANVRRSP
jgi:hypothetical protein